jgi:hypothetical protein
MWAKVESDSVTELYPRPKSIKIGDVQHPHNIFESWSKSELEAIGIYEVVEDNTNKKDERYYTNTNISYTFASGTVTASYGTAIASDLALEKGFRKTDINDKAADLLQQYDWYTLRAASGGTAIPSAVSTYQAAVRTKSGDMETLIDGAADIDALAALYVYNSDDPPTRPLGEWPNEPS